MSSLIALKNITLKLNSKLVLNGINLEVVRGERVSLYGRSGSGKSTVLKMMVGGFVPTSGEVWFDGEKMTAQTVAKIRQSIAFIDQEPLLGAETVREGILLPFTYRINQHLRPEDSTIEKILTEINLPVEILTQRTAEISGGEKQRLAIARSILLKKGIFLLDEVTSALDAESKRAVFELFCREKNYTIISVNHDFEWMQHCQRFVEIDNGQIADDHTDFDKMMKMKELLLPGRGAQ